MRRESIFSSIIHSWNSSSPCSASSLSANKCIKMCILFFQYIIAVDWMACTSRTTKMMNEGPHLGSSFVFTSFLHGHVYLSPVTLCTTATGVCHNRPCQPLLLSFQTERPGHFLKPFPRVRKKQSALIHLTRKASQFLSNSSRVDRCLPTVSTSV